MLQLKRFLERLRNMGWTIKIIPKLKQEISILHFNALDALRLSFVGFLALFVVVGYFVLAGHQDRASVQTLSKNLQIKNAQLREVEYQKMKMQNLLSHKEGELEEHLLQMRSQEEEIKRMIQRGSHTGVVLQKTVALSPTAANERIRFSQRSSRGGSYNLLVVRLSALERQIAREQVTFDAVKQLALIRREALVEESRKLSSLFDRIPSVWPVLGEVTSGFGYRVHPIDGEGEFHSGLDIATGYASPIRAAARGTCVYADYKSGFGLTVLIDHGNGLATQYSHCSRILTRVGASARKGETIALVGTTGYSTGPHVHYELHYHNTAINPTAFLGLTPDELADRGGVQALVSTR